MSNYDIEQIVDEGGNMIALAEVDPTTFALKSLTKGVNALDLGHIAESEGGTEGKKEVIKNEAKVIVKTTFEQEGRTTGTLMQRGVALIDFLENKVKGKVFLEIKNYGNVEGSDQEAFAIVMVTPGAMTKTPGGASSLKYESTYIAPPTDVTYDSAAISAIETALGITISTTSVTIKSGEYRGLTGALTPEFTSPDSINFAENGTGVAYLASAESSPGLPLAYSITGGVDAALFDIGASTGEVTFKAAPDYEDPDDFDGDNNYEIIITVSDGVNSNSKAVTITVTNVTE